LAVYGILRSALFLAAFRLLQLSALTLMSGLIVNKQTGLSARIRKTEPRLILLFGMHDDINVLIQGIQKGEHPIH
jgi:hypothetical protein